MLRQAAAWPAYGWQSQNGGLGERHPLPPDERRPNPTSHPGSHPLGWVSHEGHFPAIKSFSLSFQPVSCRVDSVRPSAAHDLVPQNGTVKGLSLACARQSQPWLSWRRQCGLGGTVALTLGFTKNSFKKKQTPAPAPPAPAPASASGRHVWRPRHQACKTRRRIDGWDQQELVLPSAT